MSQCLSDAEILRCATRRLSPGEQPSVEEHLLVCVDCAARVAAARGVSPGLVAAGPARPLTEAGFSSGTLASRVTLEDDPPLSDSGGLAPGCSVSYEEPSIPSVSLEEFLTSLSQSGLLSPLDLAVVRKRSSSDSAASDVNSVIGWLVKEHKLTHYQAQVLARGKGGALILGNYIILEKLGQGGMGTVFKARHRRMNRLVALKVLPAALASIPEAIARFQREVQAAAALQHPHIATAYDADEAAGVHFLVMEYVDGPTLAAYVKATGPVSLAAAVRLTAQAARGLAAAHAAGFVHRDIKPSNLIVSRQGVLKILDLGLVQFHGEEHVAEHESAVTRTGSVMGTVDYMAPEQARDAKSVDHRADMYSLGCTLYFLVTGAPPAPPGSAAEKLLWHQTINPLPLAEVCPQATPRLAALAQRLIAKRPEDRPASMDEIVAELDACAAEFPPGQAELAVGQIALSHDHNSSTMGGTGIHATQRELTPPPSSAPAQASAPPVAPLPLPPARQRSRWLAYACGMVGIAALVAIFAGPLLTRGPQPAPVPPTLPANSGSGGEAANNLPPPTEPLKSSPHVAYERLLTWIFRNGGSVTANTGKGQQLTLTSESALPGEAIEIIAVRLPGTGIRDAELVHLAEAPRLRELSLANTKVSDAGLKHLQSLAQLTHLDLAETEATSAGLVHLSRLTQLVELKLQKTKVTDPGLTRLASLANLQRLYLSDTAVTDAGVQRLSALPALKLVALHGTGLSETGHQSLLAARPELQIAWDGADLQRGAALRLLDAEATLRIVDREGRIHDNLRSRETLPPGRVTVKHVDASSSARFGDDELQQLALLPEIESLSLAGVGITPDQLAQLHGLTTLKSLELGPLRVPPAALGALRKALAGCQIVVKESSDAEVARLVLAMKGKVTVATLAGDKLIDLGETAKLPADGFAVRAVNVEGIAGVDDALVARLSDLTDLESLFLARTTVTDEGVAQLASCRSLRELSLSETRISADGVGALSRLPALERLYLAGTSIGQGGVRHAASCEELTHLSLQGVQLADDDLALLKRLSRLEWLDLSGTPVSDAAAVHLQQLAGLRQLNVAETSLSDAGLEELQEALAKCRVTGDPPDPQRLAARWLVQNKATVTLDSGPLVKLESLPRDACRILAIDVAELSQLSPAEIAAQVAACPDVVSLQLSDTKLRAADLACLEKAAQLREVHLANLPVTDAALALLAGKDKLEVLDLSGSQVTGAGLATLAKSAELKHLLLAGAPIDERFLPALASFPKLEALSLAASRSVTDTGLAHIEKLTALKSLDLRGTKIGDAGLAKLAPLIALEQLDLEATTVTSAGVAKLTGLSKLRRINLGRTGVTDDVTATLAQLKQLKSINLARTKVSPESVRQLQTALPGCAIVAPTPPPRDPTGTPAQP